MRALGVNIFGGGFTIGVKRHFDVVAHFEHDEYGVPTCRLNWPEMKFYTNVDAWPRTGWGGRNKIHFLYANPPCAPFSTASHGRSTTWREDPRLQRIYDIHELLDTIQPTVMAIESVVPSWTKGRELFDELAFEARKQGYATTVLLHDAKWLNTPQQRRRVFFVYHTVRIDWQRPSFDPKSIITVRQAISKIKPRPGTPVPGQPADRLLEYAERCAPGQTFCDVFREMYPDESKWERNHLGKVVGRPSFSDRRYPWDEPAPVVLGGGKAWHPVEDRQLLIEEMMALVTFPADYKWVPGSSYNDVSCLISRGVAPNVGDWLAGNVARAITANRRINQPSYGVIDLRKPNIPDQQLEYVEFA